MTRFKKHKDFNFRYLITGGKTWALYPHTPWSNEFEKGLKYRLCERYYCPELGETRIIERCKVSSIKEAENIIRGF